MSNDFGKVLSLVTTKLNKRFGAGIVTTLVSGALKGIPVIETGIPQLDVALGVGGIPKGRIIEVFGPESAGKTTLCLKCLAQAQASTNCGIVDAEHALDPAWAERIGVDINELMISQPDTGEDCLEVAEEMIRSGVGFLIVDSVSALVPKAELEGDYGQQHMGLQARLMSQAMRKLVGAVKKTNAVLMFTNQIRMKIGVMFGNPETTPGGQALKFAASIRLDIRRGKPESVGGEVLAMMSKLKVVKNKVAPPFKVCEARLDFKQGFDSAGNLFDCLVASGRIEKRGKTYAIDGETIDHGKAKAIAAFREWPTLDKLYFEYVDSCLNKGDVEEVIGTASDEVSEEELEEIEKMRKKKKCKKPSK